MYKYIVGIFILIISLQANAQEYAVANIPHELKSRASAILRNEKIVIDMKNESNVTQTIYRAITIMNESAERYADMIIFYDKSKSIKDIKGQIIDEFGNSIGKFSQKDFKDYSTSGEVNMYDDVRVKHYTPNVSTYPYTLVFAYQIKHSQNLFIPYWTPNSMNDVAIERSSYQFTCNKDLTLRTNQINYPQPPKEAIIDNFKTLTWSIENIKARKTEPYSPTIHPQEIIVKIVPEKFFYFKKTGQVNDWNDFGKWVYDNLLKDKQDLSPETIDKVKHLTEKTHSIEEKAKVLYKYLQEKTRYISFQVGIGGLEPFPASYVDKLGYGDCKALVNYMQALLAAANVQSLYCIVEAGDKKINLDESFANAVDGNHIILCIPNGKDSIWLECTSNKHPFNYLGNFTDDRLVLACTPDGGKVLKTPTKSYLENSIIRKASLSIDLTGTVKGNVITEFSGTQFENHFENKFNNKSDQNKQLKKYYPINNIIFNDISYNIIEKETVSLIEKFDVVIENHFVKNNDQYIFSPNIFNIQKNIPESKNRSNPLYINRGHTDIDDISFTLDDKIIDRIIPLQENIDCAMGTYELKISMDGQKINYYRKLQIKDGTYTPAQYQEYYDFIDKVATNDKLRYNIKIHDKK